MNIIEYDAKSTSQYIDDLKYWSNRFGNLHYHGKYDIEQNEKEEKLPPELLRAYNELWSEDTGSLCYLTEYKGEYKIALINEFYEGFADNQNISMLHLFEKLKERAEEFSSMKIFESAQFLISEGREYLIGVVFFACDHHELVVLLPCDISKEEFDAIANFLYENLCEFEKELQEEDFLCTK